LKKKSCQQVRPRIPLNIDGIQVNFCKNPACENYGVPASSQKQHRGRNARLTGDVYTVVSSGKGIPMLRCHKCGEYPTLKSNQGIADEIQRMMRQFEQKKPRCPVQSCSNHNVSIDAGKEYYSAFGKTSGGSQRFKCKACGKVFTVSKSTARQRASHKNKTIFSLLMNKVPFKRICEIADVHPKTIYDKIDFIYKQCLAFVADREQRLLGKKSISRLYVSVDQQDYVVNWTKRSDKRNTMLSAVGSADNKTGYVFGMHLNYDALLDADSIEADAIAEDDYNTQRPFRKYARLWLQGDYDDAVNRSTSRKLAAGLNNEIEAEYSEATSRDDVEVSESTNATNRLPAKGVQVHAEYTLYGHFFYLHKLFGSVEKIRFFLDQDSGMRAACLAAFQPRIANRICDAFYVRINKELTVDEKRHALSDARKVFQSMQKANPTLSDNEVKLLLIKERMANMAEIGKWKDRWLIHPFPNMSEPEKAICYLTDYSDYDADHQAWLYNKASMHGIDCFFMQVRRRLSLLERPIKTASKTGRTWHGYSPYNPAVIAKLLGIFRVYYSYCLAGKDKKTPAMRIGLAKGIVPLEDIIYFG